MIVSPEHRNSSKDVPRPYRELPAGHQGRDPSAALRANLQVVVDRGHLPVEGEPEVTVCLGPRHDLVEDVDQPEAEDVERLIPLAIPVRVRDKDHAAELAAHASAASPSSLTPSRSASRRMMRWLVMMSARPSATPARGGVPSVTIRWNATSSFSKDSPRER